MKRGRGSAVLVLVMAAYCFIPLLAGSEGTGYAGFAGWVHNPFSEEVASSANSIYLLISVIHYFLLLPVLLFLSVRDTILYISDMEGVSKVILAAGAAGAAFSMYIILGLAFRAVTVNEHGNIEEKLSKAIKGSITEEALALDMNEVCWQTRFKLLRGEIHSDFRSYKNNAVVLLKQIIGTSTYPVLREITITEVTDTSITFEASAENKRGKMQARVYNNNTHVLLESVGIYRQEEEEM